MAETNGTARWANMAAVIGVAFVFFSAIVTLYMRADAAFTKANALEQRLAIAEELARHNQADLAVTTANLREVETQFCASDIVRNLMHANDLREISMLWRKTYGVEYPVSNAYYPAVCNRAVH